MDVVKFIGKKTSPELAALAAEVMEHYKRREGETEEEFSRRLWHDMPQRKYAEMPIELQALVDTYATLEETREFFRRCIPAQRWEELSADQMGLSGLLAKIPRTASWIIQASIKKSADTGEMLDVGLYPNLTGTALLQAWKEITGEDIFGEDDTGEPGTTGSLTEAGTVELTQLITTDKVIFPTSKAFWKQPIIAREGADGASISVDNKNTLITASISDLDGKEIKISGEQQHLQAVIGQMILENGAPITVTPAQLYRAYAGMPADAHVHPTQEAAMVEALDPLLRTAAQLDFTQEIEKHTRIKRDPDYDYQKTRLTGSLVTGVKIEAGQATYNGKALDVAYIIYAVPIYFAYSKAINQLATVDRSILMGGAATKKRAAVNPDGKPQQKRTRNVNLRRYLMAQVERIKKDKEKSASAALAKKKKPPAMHTEHLTFETIATSCGIEMTPNIRQQLRQDVKLILLDFKQLKYIRDAAEYKEGRTIKGMEITV